MAQWTVTRTPAGLTFIYRPFLVPIDEQLGTTHPDTHEDAIVEWWIHQDATTPFDVLILPSGRRLALLPGSGSA